MYYYTMIITLTLLWSILGVIHAHRLAKLNTQYKTVGAAIGFVLFSGPALWVIAIIILVSDLIRKIFYVPRR